MVGGDPIAVVEAAYRIDNDDAAWMRGILEGACPLLDEGLGVAAWTYSIDKGTFDLTSSSGIGAPDSVFHSFERAVTALPSKQLLRCYLSSSATTMSQQMKRSPREIPALDCHLSTVGARDILRASLADANGQGIGVGALLPRERSLSSREQDTLTLLAAHLLAGLRLRRRTGEVEAVLTPRGAMVDAAHIAKTERARASLREAAIAIDQARGRMRREEPEAAMSQWRSLVEGRWSIVDFVDRNGRRYLVARENTPATPLVAGLSRRETQVAARIAAGHAIKLIAADLGISHSTVMVHLDRALRKLGLSNRHELSGILAPWAPCWKGAQRASRD